MFRARRLTLRLAVAAIGLAAVFGVAGATDAGTAATPAQISSASHGAGDHELAVTTRAATPKSVVEDRSERTHPSLLLWVAAFLALLLLLQVRTRHAERRPLARPRLSWVGRFDRGPPAALIAS